MFLHLDPAAQPVMPTSYQPKQNQADSGTAKIKVIPTQLSYQMPHPVDWSLVGDDATRIYKRVVSCVYVDCGCG